VSVSGLTNKLTKFAQSKKAKKIMGLTGGLLVGSLIGSEIGDIGENIGGFFEGAEGDAAGFFDSEEAVGAEEFFVGGGGGGGGTAEGDAAYGSQQGPSGMDYEVPNFMHESNMAGISTMHA
jgi:hypothetical protein